MKAEQYAGLIVSGLFVVAALTLVIRYELTPTRKVLAKVVRFWSEHVYEEHRRYLVEVEKDGRLITYTCGATEYSKLRVGETVRLHLKGTFAEYIRPLGNAAQETERLQKP